MFVATENGNIVVINDNYFIEIKRLKPKHNKIPRRELEDKRETEREMYSYKG